MYHRYAVRAAHPFSAILLKEAFWKVFVISVYKIYSQKENEEEGLYTVCIWQCKVQKQKDSGRKRGEGKKKKG